MFSVQNKKIEGIIFTNDTFANIIKTTASVLCLYEGHLEGNYWGILWEKNLFGRVSVNL